MKTEVFCDKFSCDHNTAGICTVEELKLEYQPQQFQNFCCLTESHKLNKKKSGEMT
jgi:hypothetical protein